MGTFRFNFSVFTSTWVYWHMWPRSPVIVLLRSTKKNIRSDGETVSQEVVRSRSVWPSAGDSTHLRTYQTCLYKTTHVRPKHSVAEVNRVT